MVNQFLESEAGKASSIFDELQKSLSAQQMEMATFARELRQVLTMILTLLFLFNLSIWYRILNLMLAFESDV